MSALAPGTQANRQSQARVYLAFMLAYGLDAFSPEPTDIIMYIQLLQNSDKTIGTIKNYTSGAKTFLLERGRPGEAFSHHTVTTFVKGLARKSSHVPRQAASIPVRMLLDSCMHLRAFSTEGEILAACVLVAFSTLLRQCHLVYTPHGHMHLIRRRDVVFRGGSMYFHVRSSKTTDSNHLTVIPIHAVGDAWACPVRACRTAMTLVPGPPGAPIFLDPRTGLALHASRANTLFRLALGAAGFEGAPLASLHSLRRTGAQVCAKAGLHIDKVKDHGLWRSGGIRAYVPKHITDTPEALSASLSNNA